ncbi:MAG: PilZ domain-containing protein [Pseudomonadota bacterium]
MSSNRRQHTRSLKALDFSCYIDGQQFDARSLDVSAGGAFMETGALVPVGSVALIALTKGNKEAETRRRAARRQEFPVLLLGLVVRHQTTPVSGVGLQWLRCVSRVGLQPMLDFLGFVLDLYPSTLPLPASEVTTLDFVEFDFVLQEFRPGRLEDRGWDPDGARPTTGGRTPLLRSLRTDAVLAAAPTREEEAPPPPEPPEEERSFPFEASRELVYRPTTVEVVIGARRIRGVVHSLGRRHLLLATPGGDTVAATHLMVRFPVPLKGQKIIVQLHCDIRGANPMEGRDAVSYDLQIQTADEGSEPGIWERWVRFLLEKRVFIS